MDQLNTARSNQDFLIGGGTFGQVASKSLYEQKKKQYPNQYVAKDFSTQYGKRVHDCVGLIKGYLWTNDGKLTYNASQDKDVSGMKANCFEVGSIKDIPEIQGLLVFTQGHVGVYIGNGKVIEARGHAYGVVETMLGSRTWTHYGKLKWIDYIEEDNMADVPELSLVDKINKIKEVMNIDDNTIQYNKFYKYGVEYIDKQYKVCVDAEKWRKSRA